MDEKRRNQIVDAFKKVDPKVIADALREVLRSEDGESVSRPVINPNQNSPK